MTSPLLLHFNEDGCTNLYQWVRDIPPAFICDVPKAYHRQYDGSIVPVSDLIVSSNIIGIRRAWGLARGLGESTLSYSYPDNNLIIRPGIIGKRPKICGQVAAGLVQTHWNNDEPAVQYCGDFEDKVAHFYGIQSYIIDRGHSIFTAQLICLINSYMKQIYTIIHRVENSYGTITALEGLDMGDEPLLDIVQEKINSDWDKSRRILAPGGSKVGEVDISLTDTDKMLIPLEDAISTESQVPRELLFPNKTASQFELEKLAVWAKKEFMLTVAPALWKILLAQGYDVVEICPPSYRDSHYEATVKNVIADTVYKQSAAAKNDASAEAIKLGKDAPGTNMGRQL
jgi:hypothetical protein